MKPGYKQTEVGEIPNDWDVKPLGDTVDFLDGRRRPVKDSDRAKMRGDIPYYGASGIVDYVNAFLFNEELILLGEDGENILSRNCRLAFKIKGKTWVNNHAHVLKPRPGMSLDYLAEFLESRDYAQYNTGTAQPKLNKFVCSGIPVVCPPPPEQRAIAGALSDVDALMASLDQLIAKKRDLKQAAMQQLLTGQTRLPGFKGGREVKRLGDCLLSRPDYGINAAAVPYSDKLPSYIRITDISEHGRFCPDPRVSVKSANADQYYLDEGDIVFARTGASVGKSYLYDVHDGELVFAGFLIRVRPNPETLVAPYLAAYVTTKPYWNWVHLMSMRSGQPGINGNEFAELPLALPSLPEQTAIAEVLTDMDAELAAMEQRLEKTRALKQGMMQELLTGRTRLV